MRKDYTTHVGPGGVKCSCCGPRLRGNKKDRTLNRRVRAASKARWKKEVKAEA